MWKVGDKIRFIKDGRLDSTCRHGFTINKIYKIKVVHNDNHNEMAYQVFNDKNYIWFIEPKSFELESKKKPITEVDFLDAIQENFKYD